MQGYRFIIPTGRTFATNFLSWSHEHNVHIFYLFFYTTFD